MYNGTMSRFDPRPGRAGSIAPGKRRSSSAAPTIVFRDEQPYLVIGAPGGSYIAPSVAQGLMNVIDFGMSMHEAVAAPRIAAVSNVIEVSNRIPRYVTDAVAARGYELKRSWQSYAFAALHGIRIEDGRREGGADPQRDGMALDVADERLKHVPMRLNQHHPAHPRDPPTHEASAGPLLKSAVARRAKAESGDPGAKRKELDSRFRGNERNMD
jgi:Gamma-glutamyltranspeptidase